MNPDNPYAAPQTIEPQQASLPLEQISDEGPRRLFAEWETARLKALLERSNAIKDMQVVWLVLSFAIAFLGGSVALLLVNLGLGFLGLVLVSVIVLTLVRFGTGFARTEQGRGFALVMDGSLGLGCLATVVLCIGMALTDLESAILTLFVIPIPLLIGFQVLRSLRAMWQAPELFGPAQIRHQDLLEEVEFRQQPPLN